MSIKVEAQSAAKIQIAALLRATADWIEAVGNKRIMIDLEVRFLPDEPEMKK